MYEPTEGVRRLRPRAELRIFIGVLGPEFHGKTLGLIGLGHVGRHVVRIGAVFDTRKRQTRLNMLVLDDRQNSR